ncbi:MAG: hypothetical protein PHS59_17440 [Paludibacter sp.]|nr:hypothetical protein [Paludibacter sp.]
MKTKLLFTLVAGFLFLMPNANFGQTITVHCSLITVHCKCVNFAT